MPPERDDRKHGDDDGGRDQPPLRVRLLRRVAAALPVAIGLIEAVDTVSRWLHG